MKKAQLIILIASLLTYIIYLLYLVYRLHYGYIYYIIPFLLLIAIYAISLYKPCEIVSVIIQMIIPILLSTIFLPMNAIILEVNNAY